MLRSGIPIFLSPTEYEACRRKLAAKQWLWDRYASARRDSLLTRMYYDWWVSEMLREVPPDQCGPILELMCGGAEISRRLPSRFASVVAFDLNVVMLERAARELGRLGESRVTFVGGSADRLPFPDGSIPVVMVQGGLHHVKPILASVLREVARVLAPDGIVVASEPANDNRVIRRFRQWQYTRSNMHGEGEQGFVRAELAGRLFEAGLRLRRYRRFGFLGYMLMGNTDLLPVLANCSWAWLGRALLFADTLQARVPLLRGLLFASLFIAAREDTQRLLSPFRES